MSTKIDARRRKAAKEQNQHISGAVEMDKLSLSVGWVGAATMIGLFAAAICVILGVSP